MGSTDPVAAEAVDWKIGFGDSGGSSTPRRRGRSGPVPARRGLRWFGPSCQLIRPSSAMAILMEKGALRYRDRAMPSRTNPSEQLDPDSIGIADEGKFISLLLERVHFGARSLRDEFSEGVSDIGDAERQVVEFLTFAVTCKELALCGIPVEFQPLRRTRAAQFDPHAAVAHLSPPGDFHAHHLAVKLKGPLEVSHPDPGVKILRDNHRSPNGSRSGLSVVAAVRRSHS